MRKKGLRPRLDQAGIGIAQAVIMTFIVAAVAYAFTSRTVYFKQSMLRYQSRNEIVSDRQLLKYDLVFRPLPRPD